VRNSNNTNIREPPHTGLHRVYSKVGGKREKTKYLLQTRKKGILGKGDFSWGKGEKGDPRWRKRKGPSERLSTKSYQEEEDVGSPRKIIVEVRLHAIGFERW